MTYVVIFCILIGFSIWLASVVEDTKKSSEKTTQISESVNLDDDDDDDELSFPIYSKVRGVTFENRQKYLEASEEGDELTLKHDPCEEYPERIFVFNERIKKTLGCVSASLSEDLVAKFGEYCEFDAEITEITGGDGRSYGCNFVINAEK